jgi:hypothetical protein
LFRLLGILKEKRYNMVNMKEHCKQKEELQMGKQTNARKRPSQQRGRSRPRSRKSAAKKQRPLGLWFLLIGIVLAMGVWALTRIPPGLLVMGSIAVLVVILLLIGIGFVFRSRLTPEELQQWQGQQMEAIRMEETAHMVDVRPVQREDLAHLSDSEFEELTIALLEAMGVAYDVERVGGAGDRGIDLRGKNRFGQLLIVQCKRFFGYNVAPKYTREFGGTIGPQGAREAWFVTTTFFSPQAKADVFYFTRPGLIVLVDGEQLITFIHQHWDALPSKWQWRLTECVVESDRHPRGEEQRPQ